MHLEEIYHWANTENQNPIQELQDKQEITLYINNYEQKQSTINKQ